MKFIFLILLTSLASIHGKETWLEILAPPAQTAERSSSPGPIQDEDSEAFREHWKALQIIQKALSGAPANFPTTWDDSSVTSITLSTLSIRELASHLAKTREWNRLFALYETCGMLSKRIKASEPPLIGILVAKAHERLPFEHLPFLMEEPDENLRRAAFARFRALINEGPLKLSEIGATGEAETKFSVDLAKNLPKFIARSENFVSGMIPEHLREEVTPEILLKLPFDAKLSAQKAREENHQAFIQFKAGKPGSRFPGPKNKKEKQPLSYYQNHPNGMSGMLGVNDSSFSILRLRDNLHARHLMQHLTIKWLILESEGKEISLPEELLAEFSTAEQQAITIFKLRIDFKSRAIIRPSDPSDQYSREEFVSVPNLFNK